MNSKLSEKQRNLKQIPFRLHVNDHKELKSKVSLDGLKIQTIVEACLLAYLDGDAHVKQLAKEHKKLQTIDKDKFTLSPREQDRILDEISGVAGAAEDEDE